jgi:RecJ-like exonuclease
MAEKKEKKKESFEAISAKYGGYQDVELVDAQGVVQLSGTITQIRQFRPPTIIVIRDNDFPLAWAVVYRGEGKVRHLSKNLTMRIIPNGNKG